jgi:hypothetical protein
MIVVPEEVHYPKAEEPPRPAAIVSDAVPEEMHYPQAEEPQESEDEQK